MFVLPLSFLLRNFIALRDAILFPLEEPKKAMETHKKKVERVQQAVKKRPPNSKLCTARAPWQNLSTRFATYKNASTTCLIDVSDFRQVLDFDPVNLTVTVEPLVEVSKITDYLLKRGFMLATTLEIKEATIGGLAMAVGMTTASHKYGLLSETVLNYEVILSSGEVVNVSEKNNEDLFWALPWSHGSLCLLLSLKLKIIPVTKFVKVEYFYFETQKEYCEKIRDVSKSDADFVEATIWSKDTACVMIGNFVNEIDLTKVYNPNLWFQKWFYLHVKDKKEYNIEYIPTKEYIFRHDRGIFWTLRDQLDESLANTLWFRVLFGWLFPPKVTFLKLPATKEIKKEMMTERVYQDIVLPIHTLEEAITKAADLFKIFPILVYPSLIHKRKGQFQTKGKEGMFYDLGVYGIPKVSRKETVQGLRQMEEYTRKHGGAPFLYADTFMSREEFEDMFDLTLYEEVRKKYNAEGSFPHLYDKTSGCQSFDWKKIIEE
eukprot:augustus_masked-scaffold_5-processed-gene-7.48-mRNA-1 protein AED:0.41 eAED:0.43 QI:0/-1/0/1/-1/1/1/0/488